ncbi:Alpha/Beta hydrolase protein [Macrophomina phaseolina]|uniref:carboxypeptidase C n=1 Tax=Macrophomina phaseolina TaxID=35725 RepID=A0ABQ8GVN8_9PEZI|nr:Alpha/Beta hydrolase protein [Macrophomina phaseolina]
MSTILAVTVLLSSVRVATARPTAQEPFRTAREWAIYEQDNRTCDAGSRTFAGTVNVIAGKSLFFWFVESRQNPGDRPVLVWLNGCVDGNSWLTLAPLIPLVKSRKPSVRRLKIHVLRALSYSQLASAGFSTVDDESRMPGELDDASPDFSALISTFFTSIFPQYASNGAIFASESHGGRYVPRYVYDIARAKRTSREMIAFPIQLWGIILIDALSTSSKYFRFNESACTAMAAATAEYENLFELCEVTHDPYSCKAAGDFCDNEVGKYFTEEYMSAAGVRTTCANLALSCPCAREPIPRLGSLNTYLTKPDIQRLLGIGRPVNYSDINYALNEKWTRNPIVTVPSTSEVVYLLDEEDLDVLGILPKDKGYWSRRLGNIPGTLRLYDGLGWRGQAGYRAQKLEERYWKDGSGKASRGGVTKSFRNLQFCSIDDAGHQSPGDQRGAVASLFGRGLEEIRERG